MILKCSGLPPGSAFTDHNTSLDEEELREKLVNVDTILRRVESLCIKITTISRVYQDLSPEKYDTVIKLHQALLHEHKVFFLACQHPSAGQRLNDYPIVYDMTRRIWKHAIQPLLGLNDSCEYMRLIEMAHDTMECFHESYHGDLRQKYNTRFLCPEDSEFITWLARLARVGSGCARRNGDSEAEKVWAGRERKWLSKTSYLRSR